MINFNLVQRKSLLFEINIKRLVHFKKFNSLRMVRCIRNIAQVDTPEPPTAADLILDWHKATCKGPIRIGLNSL